LLVGDPRHAVADLDLDLDKAIWTVPAGDMKTRREYRVPLSCQGSAITHPLLLRNSSLTALRTG
jgi:hypothetical protein